MKTEILVCVIGALFMGTAGWFQGRNVGRPTLGAMLGFWAGLPGLAVMAFIGWRWPKLPKEAVKPAPEGALFGADDSTRLDEPVNTTE